MQNFEKSAVNKHKGFFTACMQSDNAIFIYTCTIPYDKKCGGGGGDYRKNITGRPGAPH